MTAKSIRWISALMATVLGILLLPFAVPGFGGPGGVSAFATGTVVHADLLQNAGTKLVDAEVGFSGAVFESGGLVNPIFNELDRELAPKLPGKVGFARGAGVEVGLGVSPTTDNQAILAGKAVATTRPNTAPVTTGAGPIDLDPLVWADLLRGQAAANAGDGDCALGTDASHGLAYVADAQLLDTASASSQQSTSSSSQQSTGASGAVERTVETVSEPVSGLLGAVKPTTQQVVPAEQRAAEQPASSPGSSNEAQAAPMPNVEGLEQPLISLDADGPARAVSQSRSRTVFVAQRDRDGRRLGNAFGVMSEVRQTIAPITLFEGTSNEVTIELLGEWVLQAVAGGLPGTGYIHYGPGRASPETPVLRLIDASGVTTILKLQDLVTDDGFVLNIPGVAEIAIGEAPRAIDGEAGSTPVVSSSGTTTAAAVDVVRVRALPGAPVHLTDLRVGHMEVRAQVPAGGTTCSIPVSKRPSVEQANVGDTFDVVFKVTNPYDCTLSDVRLDDVLTTEDAARFEVIGTDPAASSAPAGAALESGTVTWSNIGDLAPRETRTVTASFGARGGAGAIIDTATAAGKLTDCADPGATVAGVDVGVVNTALTGTTAEVRVPTVSETRVLSESGRNLPLTGAPILFMVAFALVSIAIGSAAALQASRLR
jgi:hypothetical protein